MMASSEGDLNLFNIKTPTVCWGRGESPAEGLQMQASAEYIVQISISTFNSNLTGFKERPINHTNVISFIPSSSLTLLVYVSVVTGICKHLHWNVPIFASMCTHLHWYLYLSLLVCVPISAGICTYLVIILTKVQDSLYFNTD